jgi:glycosyltransferase involved in cell wall biosynthesis
MRRADAPSVVYVLPDKMGGTLTIVANLLRYREADGWTHHAVLTRNTLDPDSRWGGRIHADTQRAVEYSLPVENLHAVLHRLARAVPPGPGVLVANDLLELAMLWVHDAGRTAVQILHGDHDYYYDLAVTHAPVVDAYVCYGRVMYERLVERMPDRRRSIFYLPYGIPLPSRVRTAVQGPLRVLFSGRLEHMQKGVLDLPAIDAALRARGVAVCWTVVGGGPDEAALRRAWTRADVRWLGVLSNEDAVAQCAAHDVFVLPARAEGVPVALVEAMAAGTVPVVTDLPSGVREIVSDGESGCLVPRGHIEAFAGAIAALDRDRARLEEMSTAARRAIEARFDVRARTREYQALYARYRELKRPRPERLVLPYGSRLDVPWIPNAAVSAVRTARRWLHRTARRPSAIVEDAG